MSFARKLRMKTKVQYFCDKCEDELVDSRMKTKHKKLISRKIKYQEAGLFGLLDRMDDDVMYGNRQAFGLPLMKWAILKCMITDKKLVYLVYLAII